MELDLLLKQLADRKVEFFTYHERMDKFEIELHSHAQAQLLYAEGGIVHIFVNEHHWYLPTRCYIWIPSHVKHSILSYSKNVQLYNFYFSVGENENDFYNETNIYFADDLLREMLLFTKKWQGEAVKGQGAAYQFLAAIKAVLPEMQVNKIPFSVQHPFPKDQKLIEIANFLMKNMYRNYAIEDIAKIFGISVRTLSRRFKSDLGMNYVRFLRSLRITKSLELIAENKYSMLEIALSVGYSSLSSFSNVFFKVTKLRPSDYASLFKK